MSEPKALLNILPHARAAIRKLSSLRAEMRPRRIIQAERDTEGFLIRLKNMFLFHSGVGFSKNIDPDHEQKAYEGTCMVMCPIWEILRTVSNWFSVRPRSFSKPRKQAGQGG